MADKILIFTTLLLIKNTFTKRNSTETGRVIQKNNLTLIYLYCFSVSTVSTKTISVQMFQELHDQAQTDSLQDKK